MLRSACADEPASTAAAARRSFLMVLTFRFAHVRLSKGIRGGGSAFLLLSANPLLFAA
jgi:hypothetical protein